MILDIYCKKKNPNTVVVANLFLNFQIVSGNYQLGWFNLKFRIKKEKRKEKVTILSLSYPIISDN